jgi:flagellar biosynthesis/type III secretory pathway M-ring protein FliF/YscJ
VQVVAVILAFALLAVVLFVVSGPLRAPASEADAESDAMVLDRAELEAARESKYREIRDAELDRRMGKLSAADYEAIDSALRAEALEILDRLQALQDREAAQADPAAPVQAPGESDAHG